jgi:hypothetical protein
VLGGDDGAASEHTAQAFDVGSWPVGEVAESTLTDLAVLSVALAQETGDRNCRDAFLGLAKICAKLGWRAHPRESAR